MLLALLHLVTDVGKWSIFNSLNYFSYESYLIFFIQYEMAFLYIDIFLNNIMKRGLIEISDL